MLVGVDLVHAQTVGAARRGSLRGSAPAPCTAGTTRPRTRRVRARRCGRSPRRRWRWTVRSRRWAYDVLSLGRGRDGTARTVVRSQGPAPNPALTCDAAPVSWNDAASAPGCRAAQHGCRRPFRQRRADLRRAERGRGGRSGPLRRARARHPGVSAGGPAPQARIHRRQRGRTGKGGSRHGAVRGRRGVRGRGAGRLRAVQRGGRLRGGRVAGVYRKRFLPNYGVFDEQRWFIPSTNRRRCSVSQGRGSACPSARTYGSTTDRWHTRDTPVPMSW